MTNASLSYGQAQVLQHIHLTIHDGEKVALLGPSGAGKSSLLNLLYQQRADRCALCPQDNGLVDILSAYHNIFMGGLDRHSTPASLWNLVRPLKRARTAIEAIATQLGLGTELWKSVDRLSGGQRQRVALGRALFRKKDIFLGDEPVSALDPIQAETLMQHVLSQHATAVVCLHSPVLALALFDRVVVMKAGSIELDQPTRQLTLADLNSNYITDVPADRTALVLPEKSSVVSSPEACVTGKIQR
ncbi:MAG: phosphonate ABC transporter ATP-binding protein [Oceanospirillaceae bacterium]|nr:phosphonate ABC transporter ATP-binding protein [Oceanospirillaceae bacterium]